MKNLKADGALYPILMFDIGLSKFVSHLSIFPYVTEHKTVISNMLRIISRVVLVARQNVSRNIEI